MPSSPRSIRPSADQPTNAQPGSQAKIDILIGRLQKGLPLHLPDDLGYRNQEADDTHQPPPGISSASNCSLEQDEPDQTYRYQLAMIQKLLEAKRKKRSKNS